MRDIQDIINNAYKSGIDSLSETDRIVYYICDFSVIVEMDGLAGYLTSENRKRFIQVITAFNAIGCPGMADKLICIKHYIGEVMDNEAALMDAVYGEGDCGKYIDDAYNAFNDGYDNWRQMIQNYAIMNGVSGV